MKSKIIMGTLVLSFFVILPFQTFAASDKISWQKYDQGISMAKENGKKVFLYFHADWCKYCVKMGNTTFKDEQVVSLLNNRFIPIQVDADKQTKIAEKYGVTGLPNSWFLQMDASPINRLPGYVDGELFTLILKYIETDSFQKMSFQEFTRTL